MLRETVLNCEIMKETKAPICQETGQPMVRDVRPMKISYKNISTTIDMPGWYCHDSCESQHEGEDLKVSDTALYELRDLYRLGFEHDRESNDEE
jgi:hypothetical protein